jgi:hypothetical protein
MQIAIRCWSRDRARQMTDKALKVPPDEMERFLTELLTDALLTYNESFNRCYSEHVEQLWRLLNEKQAMTSPPPLIIPATRKPDRG